MNALAIAESPLDSECLTASQWSDLLGVTPRAFRLRHIEPSDTRLLNGGLTKVFAFSGLPTDYQETALELRDKHRASTYQSLMSMRRVDRRWEPDFEFGAKPAATQEKAHKVRNVMAVYFAALDSGRTKCDANTIARAEWVKVFGGECNEKTIRRYEARIERAGGHEAAPLEAYCDNKDVKHARNTKGVPHEFLLKFRSKCCEPGHINVSRAMHHYRILWETGQEVPGFGARRSEDQAFPLSESTMRKFAPGRAAREVAGRGKFSAKAKGALPALPLSSRALWFRARIVFDDKRPDIVLLDDDSGAQFEPQILLAMDESTKQILGWAFRGDGHMRQMDSDAFTAGILRSAGFCDGAGFLTTLKYERGATPISTDREWLLKNLFPRNLDISRTSMIGGHNVPGDFAQKASGNFMGKGKLESFMRTFDCFFAHLAGQRGNNGQLAQPSMLGDTTLTLKTVLDPNYKIKGTMIEEALLCAHSAMAVSWMAGEDLSAREAAERTGIVPPLLFKSEFIQYMAVIIAYYNRRRGHRMEGFQDITITNREGKPERVTESPDDKARRLEQELAGQGGRIARLSEADTMLLLHKAKKVCVKPNGVSLLGKLFWSEHSKAIWEAQHNTTLEKYYLALYDPQRLNEIYLLRNPVSHFREKDESLSGETPVFFEVLPLYVAPDQTNPEQMRERAGRIATNTNRVMREVAIVTQPYIDEQTQRRLANTEKLREIRATIMTIEPKDRPVLSATGAAQGFSEAVSDHANNVTRAEAQPAAASHLDKFLAKHAPKPETPETEPEIF